MPQLVLLLVFCLLPALSMQAAPRDSLRLALEAKLKAGQNDSLVLDLMGKVIFESLEKDLALAAHYSYLALDMAEKQGRKNYVTYFCTGMGHMYRAQGLHTLALKFYLRALSQSRKDTAAMAFTYNDIGNVYFNDKKYEQAQIYYAKGLTLSRQKKAQWPEIVSLNNLGLCQAHLGHLAEAIAYFKKALRVSRAYKSQAHIALDYRYMGNTYREMKDYPRSHAYFDSAAVIYKQLGDDSQYGNSLFGQSRTYLEQKDLPRALHTLHIAEKYLLKIEAVYKLPDIYCMMATVHQGLKHYDSAMQVLDKATDISLKQHNLFSLQFAYTTRAQLLEERGMRKDALKYWQLYENVKDTLFNEELEQKLSELNTDHQLREKALAVDSAQLQIKLQKARLAASMQENRVLGFAAFFGVILIGMALLHFRARHKRSLQLQQAQAIVLRQQVEIAQKARQVEEAKQEAEKHLRAKSDFLSNMSHEIRTPMHAIMGFTDLLLQDNKDTETRQNLEAVKFSAGNLTAILNDILELSKLESAPVKPDIKTFDPTELLRELKRAMEVSWAGKPVALHLDIAPDIPQQLKGDSGRLYQILLNLAGNAMKFTPEGSVYLRIRSSEQSGQAPDLTWLCFEVEDTGIGIPAEKQAVIFQSFTQAEEHTTRLYGGTGLGLTISQKLAELMGGFISLSSQPGLGSCFSLDLPFKLPEADALVDLELSENQSLATFSPWALKGKRVLCVDDNPPNLVLLCKTVKRWGLICSKAPSAEVALQCLASEHFDLVITDIHMPDMNGMELARRIREENGSNRHTPILGLTADVSHETYTKCQEAGIDLVALKPIHIDDLYQRLTEMLDMPDILDKLKMNLYEEETISAQDPPDLTTT